MGGEGRAATGHDVYNLEFVKGPDGREHGDNDKHGADTREGDIPKLLPRRPAIHISGLIKFSRDGLHRGQEGHTKKREAAPDIRQYYSHQRGASVAEPGNGYI